MIPIDKSVKEDVINRATYKNVGKVVGSGGFRSSFQFGKDRNFPLKMKKYASHSKWHLALALAANTYFAVFWSEIAFSGWYAAIGNMLLLCFLLESLTHFSQAERKIDYEEEKAGIQGLKMCSLPGLGRVMRTGR